MIRMLHRYIGDKVCAKITNVSVLSLPGVHLVILSSSLDIIPIVIISSLQVTDSSAISQDFRQGMHSYLTRHQFGNAETEDLWSALEEASGKPVQEVMSSWTRQQGFPVISVSSTQHGQERKLTLTQDRFCADGNSDGESLMNCP